MEGKVRIRPMPVVGHPNVRCRKAVVHERGCRSKTVGAVRIRTNGCYSLHAHRTRHSDLSRWNRGMEQDRLQAELRRLGDATYALAALGAALRAHCGGPSPHAEVAPFLRDAVGSVLGSSLDDLDTVQAANVLAALTLQFEQAGELLAHPENPPRWIIEDPRMLQAQGNASGTIVERFLTLASTRPALRTALAGHFLDVGTGVAALALKAAELCPTLTIVGLDIWEPALALARANVAASPHAGRIELRKQDVQQLQERALYTVVWFPAPFFLKTAAEIALDRLRGALAPGGYLIVGRYAV